MKGAAIGMERSYVLQELFYFIFLKYIHMIMMSWCDAKYSGMFDLLSCTSTFIYFIYSAYKLKSGIDETVL